MLTRLPETPRQLRRQLLVVLGAAGVLMALLAGAVSRALATWHVERAASQRVRSGRTLQIMRVEMIGKLDPELLADFCANALQLFQDIGAAGDDELHATLAATVRRYFPVGEKTSSWQSWGSRSHG